MKPLLSTLFFLVTSSLYATDYVEDCSVVRDNFKKMTTVTSVLLVSEKDASSRYSTYHFYLMSVKKDGSDAGYYLVIRSNRSHRGGWAFWKSVVDEDGKEFELHQIQRQTDSGSVIEISGAFLTRQYLDELSSGKGFRFYGKNVQRDTNLSAELIDGFLTRVDQEF